MTRGTEMFLNIKIFLAVIFQGKHLAMFLGGHAIPVTRKTGITLKIGKKQIEDIGDTVQCATIL